MLKRLKVWWMLGALVLALTLATGACGGGEEVPKEGEVAWGFMFEESGGLLENFGKPTGDGVELAVQEINAAGGFQVPKSGRSEYADGTVTPEDVLRKDPDGGTVYKIRLVKRDTRSDVQNTIAVATELVRDEQVNVIWGPATVGEPQITPTTQRAKVLHFCPCQERETTALSSVEKAQGESHWAFQTLLPFSLLIEQGAKNFLEDYPDFKTMAFLCLNNETGRDICERTKAAYEKVGIEVVGDIQYFPVGTTDYSPFLTRIRQGDPDYLFNFDNPPNDTAIVRQALQQGIGRLHIVTVPANIVEQLVGVPLTVPVTAGACCRQHVQPTSPEAAEYFDRYATFLGGRDKLPFVPFVSLLTYDYVYMLAAAMQQAGTVEDTTAIADALEDLHYDGVSENDLFFNPRHLAVHGTDPCTVQTGQPIVCEHVDPPPEAAE